MGQGEDEGRSVGGGAGVGVLEEGRVECEWGEVGTVEVGAVETLLGC